MGNLRVLHRKGCIGADGASIFILEYAKYLFPNVKFDYLLMEEPKGFYSESIRKLDGKVNRVTCGIGLIEFLRKIFLICKVLKKYDILHIDTDALTAWKILLLAKLMRVKVCILHSHNSKTEGKSFTNAQKSIFRWLNRKFADHHFACSNLAGKWMFGNDSNLVVISNAIDISKFTFNIQKRKDIRGKLGLDGNFVVGHIGRFVEQKNHKFLIDIFAEVVKKRSDARLLLLGGGELTEDIKQKVEKFGLTDKVIFIGMVSNPEDFYQAMDCFVLPSLHEGLGIVLVEAQASGLPCLYSSVVPEEAAVTNLANTMSLHEDAEKWAKWICNLQRNENRAMYAEKVAMAGYDIKVEAKKLENFYLTGKYDKEFTVSRGGGNTL